MFTINFKNDNSGPRRVAQDHYDGVRSNYGNAFIKSIKYSIELLSLCLDPSLNEYITIIVQNQ